MQKRLPNHGSQILTISRYEILKYLRGKKIFGILGIAVAVSILVIAIPDLLGVEHADTARGFLSMPINFVFFLLVISAALFGSNSLSSEFHEKTGYLLFPNPVTRTSIWLGKFLAAELISFLVIGVFYGMITGAAFFKYESVPQEIFFSFLFSCVIVTMIMSLSFLVSSALRGPTGSAVLIFFVFILILPMMDSFLITMGEIKPWFSPSFAGEIVQNILTVPYPLDIEPGELPRGPFDHERFVPYVTDSLAITSVYILSASIISILIFRKTEMT